MGKYFTLHFYRNRWRKSENFVWSSHNSLILLRSALCRRCFSVTSHTLLFIIQVVSNNGQNYCVWVGYMVAIRVFPHPQGWGQVVVHDSRSPPERYKKRNFSDLSHGLRHSVTLIDIAFVFVGYWNLFESCVRMYVFVWMCGILWKLV